MFFATILLSVITFKFFPWWMAPIVFAVVGYARPGKFGWDLLLAVVVGIVNAALAFYADGRAGGEISRRMSGLFSLPSTDLIFGVMFAIAFISAFLALQSGAMIRRLRDLSST